jgi:hypothetical protein
MVGHQAIAQQRNLNSEVGRIVSGHGFSRGALVKTGIE